jgi:hypothetical protein
MSASGLLLLTPLQWATVLLSLIVTLLPTALVLWMVIRLQGLMRYMAFSYMVISAISGTAAIFELAQSAAIHSLPFPNLVSFVMVYIGLAIAWPFTLYWAFFEFA